MKIYNNTKNKGITLISLVVTIIILLILAGISIIALNGENGLIKRSKQAKDEHETAAAQEALSMELSAILAQSQGEKKLKDLDGMKIDGYTTNVSDIARLVTMTKDKERYYFLVDSQYNIQNLNNIQGINQNPGTGTGSSSSEIINDFNIKVEEQSGLSAKINIDGEITTKDNSKILGYIVLVNGQGNDIGKTMPYTVNLEKIGTTYKIDVMAIDIYGKTKNESSSLTVTTPNVIETALDYPIITRNGMVNVKYTNPGDASDYYYGLDLSKDCTASDALDKAAYDGDETTYYNGTSTKNKFYFASDIDLYNVCFKLVNPNMSGSSYVVSGGGYNFSRGNGVILSDGDWHINYFGKGSDKMKGILSYMNTAVYEIYYDESIQ